MWNWKFILVRVVVARIAKLSVRKATRWLGSRSEPCVEHVMVAGAVPDCRGSFSMKDSLVGFAIGQTHVSKF